MQKSVKPILYILKDFNHNMIAITDLNYILNLNYCFLLKETPKLSLLDDVSNLGNTHYSTSRYGRVIE